MDSKPIIRTDYIPWDTYFMGVAYLAAKEKSGDPITKVGACVVNDQKRIVGIGYNYALTSDVKWTDPNNKEKYVCYAIPKAILGKAYGDLTNGSVYTTMFPSAQCAQLIIQSGLKQVYYSTDEHLDLDNQKAAGDMFLASGVAVSKLKYYTKEEGSIKFDFGRINSEHSERVEHPTPPEDSLGRDETLDDYYYMALAFLCSDRSKDSTTQVGACIVNKAGDVISTGYNGMPLGNDILPWNKPDKKKPEKKEPEKKDPEAKKWRLIDSVEEKTNYVCHAELNAIINTSSSDFTDCTMYVTLFPCIWCAKLIVQSGLKKVVYYSAKKNKKVELEDSVILFKANRVKYRKYDPDYCKKKDYCNTIDIDLAKSPKDNCSRN